MSYKMVMDVKQYGNGCQIEQQQTSNEMECETNFGSDFRMK
jgi:hypothetical protein